MKTYHLSITPEFILSMARGQHKPFSFFLDGHDPELTELDLEIQLLMDVRDRKNYTIGDCDNKDERGRCKGHEKESVILKEEEL